MFWLNETNIWVLRTLSDHIMKSNPFRMNLANKHKGADEK